MLRVPSPDRRSILKGCYNMKRVVIEEYFDDHNSYSDDRCGDGRGDSDGQGYGDGTGHSHWEEDEDTKITDYKVDFIQLDFFEETKK